MDAVGGRATGPRGVDWLGARTMFLDGSSIASIARTLGVRRELVSRRCSADGWRTQRDNICTETARRIADETVSTNTEILRRHDRVGDKILTVAEQRIDAMARGEVPFDSEELRDVSSTVARGAALQRAARGLGPADGMASDADRRLEVIIRRLPDTREEYEALMRDEAGGGEAR